MHRLFIITKPYYAFPIPGIRIFLCFLLHNRCLKHRIAEEGEEDNGD